MRIYCTATESNSKGQIIFNDDQWVIVQIDDKDTFNKYSKGEGEWATNFPWRFDKQRRAIDDIRVYAAFSKTLPQNNKFSRILIDVDTMVDRDFIFRMEFYDLNSKFYTYDELVEELSRKKLTFPPIEALEPPRRKGFHYRYTKKREVIYKVPEGIETILSEAFKRSDLGWIELPNSLKYIRRCAFWGCEDLQEITIPASVQQIDFGAFIDCSSLESVKFEGCPYIDRAVFAGCSSLNNVVLPEGIGRIEESTFSRCATLMNIRLPISLDTIEAEAFRECKNLKHITLPPNLRGIGERAFADCPNLTTIDFPASLTQIDSKAFENCPNLKQLYFPKGRLTNIKYDSFSGLGHAEIYYDGKLIYEPGDIMEGLEFVREVLKSIKIK